MNEKEMKLAAEMLKDHGRVLGRNCCNDWDFPDDWSDVDKNEFVREFHDWNGDPEEFSPNRLHLPDFAVAEFLASKLESKNSD